MASPLQVMSQPDSDPPAGPSEKAASRLDNVFDFQIVIFKVENTLFKVLKNGFNVPGTPFEAMFALPQAQTDSIEGSSIENSIHLPGVKVNHFRSFLRILYPFIDRTPVEEFDEWIGVLNLATMWVFQEIREKAISQLSGLIEESEKTVMERITLAREHRVVEWLRDAYVELIQNTPLDFEVLRPEEPSSNPVDRNWEADARNWAAISRDWETLARISYFQAKMAKSIMSGAYQYCYTCNTNVSVTNRFLCRCRLLAMVDEEFEEEFENLKVYSDSENVEPPLPSNGTAIVQERKRKKR